MKQPLSLIILLAWAISAPAITIDTVPVGDVGNPNDPATGNLYGGVNYAYSIGKYEVTVGQYAAFLNAVASGLHAEGGANDTYGLYNPRMASDLNIAGISRSCSASCTYSVIGSPNHPITSVSWGDAARFVNWLHNGQPSGPQNASTTEDGAYTLNGATDSAMLASVTRNANAKWFIPTENEWYKAAYYQPAGQRGDSDDYWAYPMKTNGVPYSDPPHSATPDNTRVGNFYQDDDLANGYDDGYAVTGSTGYSTSQNYLTDVGAYGSAPSYYSTFDQGGNVYEWNETKMDRVSRGLRGGSWFDNSAGLDASNRQSNFTSNEGTTNGFRVATVPEPTTIRLLTFAAVAGFSFLRRR